MPKYTKYTKEVLIEAVKNSSSIKGAIRFAGGNPSSGGVYKHVRKKIKEYNIDTSHFLGLASNRGNLQKIKKHRKKS